MIREYKGEDLNQVRRIIYAVNGNKCPWLNTDQKIENDLNGAEQAYIYSDKSLLIKGLVYIDPVQIIEGRKRIHFYIFVLPGEDEQVIGIELLNKIEKHLGIDAYRTTTAMPKDRIKIIELLKKRGYKEYFQSVLMEYEGEVQGTQHNLVETPISHKEYLIYKETSNISFYNLRKRYDMIPYHPFEMREGDSEDYKGIYTYKDGSEIIGFSKGDKELEEVIVKRSQWRKGYGKDIVKLSINRILTNGEKKVILYVIAGNKSAYNLYNKLGFKEKMVIQVMEKA